MIRTKLKRVLVVNGLFTTLILYHYMMFMSIMCILNDKKTFDNAFLPYQNRGCFGLIIIYKYRKKVSVQLLIGVAEKQKITIN